MTVANGESGYISYSTDDPGVVDELNLNRLIYLVLQSCIFEI